VLIWRGEWASAEQELSLAATELERTRPASTGPALARLGELRLRQGRFEDAERLFRQSWSQPRSKLGLAALMLERGDTAESAEIAAEFLRHLSDDEATARVAALEIIVKANAARRNLGEAKIHLGELERIGATLNTDPVLASVATARAALVRQQGDEAAAMRCLEAAVELYHKSGAPYETARTRVDLAELLAKSSRDDAARQQGQAAREAFERLEARADQERVARLLGALDSARGAANQALTPRQVEILRLVAQGMSNGQIARRLKLSEHTVKRHVANLLLRLDLPSRAAAVAYAAREGLL
jgi:DNA-binding NarL/FixJ family response regulator